MIVYIANFGQENYLWPACLSGDTIATIDNVKVHGFWMSRDREGFISYAMQHLKTARNLAPTKPVASRWYSINDEVNETEGDLWIHREKKQLWWTISLAGPAEITLRPSAYPERDGPNIYEIHKPSNPWSNRNRRGAPLFWDTLPAKAKDFLFTEGTLQRLSLENAEYAQALIAGDDLSYWHNKGSWRQREERARTKPGITFGFHRKTVYRLVATAFYTAANSNGQQVLTTIKNKNCHFDSVDAMMAYVESLIVDQEGLCAITGVKLQLDGEEDDKELRYSLDRIDSSGHYEPGNLQLVCRFINRWKSASSDADFRRLIQLVQISRF